MTEGKEVMDVSILVPFNRGSVATSEIVHFKVFNNQAECRVIPLLHQEERSFAGLPAEMHFRIEGNTVIPAITGNKDLVKVMENIMFELRLRKFRR